MISEVEVCRSTLRNARSFVDKASVAFMFLPFFARKAQMVSTSVSAREQMIPESIDFSNVISSENSLNQQS